LLTSM